ncbi:MAG: sulfate permease [Leptospiraceae bacterium]|nr:sulfate permease [Leptospiraceae bacterium]MCP5494477.1 sulfate permease [Leptospiraceae bacterium]
MLKDIFVKPDWKHDLPSGIAVFLVAVPMCLGVAHASGAPLMAGLIAGIIGGILVGTISGSSLSISGPAAGLTAVILAGLHELNSFEVFLLALLFAGIIQIILGFFRAGIIGDFIPLDVIKGLLAAIGIILILKQFPHVVGYDVEQFGVQEFTLTPEDLGNTKTPEKNTLTLLYHSFLSINFGVLIIGMLSLAILYLWEKYIIKYASLVPSSLILVIIGIGINSIYKSFFGELELTSEHLVQIPHINNVSKFFTVTPLPDFSSYDNIRVYKVAVTIALVASIETLLSIEAIDKLNPKKRATPTSRELIAQGIGNVVNAILGGIPVTSVIIRSTINTNAGAKTKNSSIFHGFLILFSIILIPNLLNQIPLATLAAILCYTGFKLTSPLIYKNVYEKGWNHFIIFIATVIGIVLTDILIGTLIGGFVSIFFIIKEIFYSSVIKTMKTRSTTKLFLGEYITFFHKARILDTLKAIPDNTEVVIDGRKCDYIHIDVIEMIQDFQNHSQSRQINVNIVGLEKFFPSVERRELNVGYKKFLEDNKDWVWEKIQDDAEYFKKLGMGQSPQFIMIGCSDSRVPFELITKAEPGKIFVHRNIANLVKINDPNLLSIIEYGITVLKIPEIIVCGHYGCGGVQASMGDVAGEVGKWIQPIKNTYQKHKAVLDAIVEKSERERKLVEFNVLEQVENLKNLPVVQTSIQKNKLPLIHAWVYDVHTGLINDLDLEK